MCCSTPSWIRPGTPDQACPPSNYRHLRVCISNGMLYNPQIMTNVNFIARNWRFLSFGFLLTFTCNIGQTFFIGLYNGVIKTHYGLSSGEFGALYGMATLCSAGLLVWIGRLVDRVDLKAY